MFKRLLKQTVMTFYRTVRRFFCLGFAVISVNGDFSSPALAQEPSLAIQEIEPTTLFSNAVPLRQIALLKVTNRTRQSVAGLVQVRINGAAEPALTIAAGPGKSEHQILIPDLASPARLQVEIQDPTSQATLAKREEPWQPQRHWRIYLTKSSHEDLGYENYIYVKQSEIADYIDVAKDLNHANGPDDPSAYAYTMESLLFMRNYIQERSLTAWWDLVEKYVKPGQLHLMSEPSGVHTHWMDYEELARMNYGGRRELKDRFGLDAKTYLMVDNPSVSWSAAQAIADSGYSYIARYGQPWRTGENNNYQTTGLPALFYWVGPNGRSKILFSWRSHYRQPIWYGQTNPPYHKFTGNADIQLSRHLKTIENGELLGPYPYDALLDPDYSDHERPAFDADALRQWHKKYRYPEIRITDPTKFFEHIEAHFTNAIPTRTGDLNNFSADYAAIDPESQGWKRKAARLLPLAEGLATVSSQYEAKAGALGKSFDDAYVRLMDYDEHSWPTSPRPNDFHVFNSQWVKHQGGRRALDHAEELLDTSFASLLRQISNPGGNRLVVFNPLAHPRTDLAEVQLSGVEIFELATGAAVPSQVVSSNLTRFRATDIPAFGYKVFGLRTNGTVAPSSRQLNVGAHSLENQLYRIEFDPQTGAITSIRDKELQRELVNPELGYQFNQFVYVHKNERVSREGFEYSPQHGVPQPGHVGPIQASFRTTIDDEKTGAHVTQDVVLYDGLKRIDIINDLQHVRALFSTNWGDRYKDNLYFAFPLKVENFDFHAEYPGGVVRPYRDQLRWGSHDYLYANRWVNTGNAEFSVTMAPWEAGTVNFGEIRYNQFTPNYQPQRPILFSYPYANRMAGLLSLGPTECNATLRYSFTSHRGDWRAGATTQFGWQIASALETRILPAAQTGTLPATKASFVELNAPNVQLVNLKHSEIPGRGWIVRLVETEGKDTPVTVKLPGFAVGGAMLCNLVEDDTEPLRFTKDSVKVLARKFSFTTIRITAREAAPASAVAQVQAQTESDQSTRLKWTPPPGGAFGYNVYRSTDPREPATIHSLIARTTANEFVDEGLALDTPYYYQVAPVSRFNQQGKLSARVIAKTAPGNHAPPAPVQDLGVVRRAPTLLMVYWQKNAEPDVAKYHLYRSQDGNFDLKAKPFATVPATHYFLQTYRDESVVPETAYYYQVFAEDTAGNTQTRSPFTRAVTARELEGAAKKKRNE